MAKSTKRNVNRTRGNDLKRTVRRGKKSNRVSSKKRSSKRGKTKQMGGAFGNKKEVIDASELNKLVKRLNDRMDKEDAAARNAQSYPGFDGYNPNKIEILEKKNESTYADLNGDAPEPPPRTSEPGSNTYAEPVPTASNTIGNAVSPESFTGFEDGEAYDTSATSNLTSTPSSLSEAVLRGATKKTNGNGN